MTFTRLGQLTAELATISNVALYSGGSVNPTISATKAKTGTYSYRLSSTVTPFGMTFGAAAAVRGGLWLNHNGVAGGSPLLLAMQIGNAPVRLQWNPTSNEFELVLGYQRNSTSLYVAKTAAAGTFSAVDTWRHVGLTFAYSATAGYCSLYIDGALALSFSGDTTLYASANQTNKEIAAGVAGVYGPGVRGTAGWANYAYVDDFYIDSAVGELDLAPPGKRFLFSLANAAGSNAEWTPLSSTNISNVDDPTSAEHDGDTTYNKALAAGLADTFGTAAITVPADHTIRAVIPLAVARKTDAVDCQLSMLAYDGANTTTGAAQAISTSYGVNWARMTVQPDGSEWNEADFNGMEFGYESAGTFV